MIDDELEQSQSGAEGYQAPDYIPAPGSDVPENADTGEELTDITSPAQPQFVEPEAKPADEQLLRDLINVSPEWLKQPQPGAHGFVSPKLPDQPTYPHSFSNKSDYTAPFPEAITEDQVIAAATPEENTNEYSFQLDVDFIDAKDYTVNIHVGYGEINDTPPDGMTGADDYILFIPGANDGTEIYAVVTYDTTTLAITSRSLAFGFSVPDSTLGTLYIPIGFVDITYDEHGTITGADPHNRQCGDIQLGFLYGAMNGAPALFILNQVLDFEAIT